MRNLGRSPLIALTSQCLAEALRSNTSKHCPCLFSPQKQPERDSATGLALWFLRDGIAGFVAANWIPQ